MTQRLLEDLITDKVGIHPARIVVEISASAVVSVYVQDMTEEESARIVPLLERYVPETFGWTTIRDETTYTNVRTQEHDDQTSP